MFYIGLISYLGIILFPFLAMFFKDSTKTSFRDSFSLELRNQIYGYLVIEEESIDCNGLDPVRPPSIIQVCKIVRDEALSMYYEKNVFYLSAASYICDMVRRIVVCHGKPRKTHMPSSTTCPIGVLGH